MNSKKIALNFIYLGKKHAGGKDQVALNLLKGFHVDGSASDMIAICYDYSEKIIRKIAPEIQIVTIPSAHTHNELMRLWEICRTNTFKLPGIIKKYEIGMVFHMNCNTGLRKQSVPTVVIPHDIKAVSHPVLANVKIPFYKVILYKLMYAIDFKNNDGIIAISEVDKNEISRFYQKYESKIKRIYNPIDFAEPNMNSRKVDNYISAVNLQFHHKNIITLIKAFELIKDQVDTDLLLIGSLPDRVHYLKDYVEEHGLRDRVRFTGYIENKEMRRLFEHSRLYVNPTLYEGFGMTAVESLISGVPTLLSGIPTNYEVTKGLCSYYEPPEDEHALAKKLLECLHKNYDREQLYDIGVRIYEEYNYQKISQLYVEYFRTFLK